MTAFLIADAVPHDAAEYKASGYLDSALTRKLTLAESAMLAGMRAGGVGVGCRSPGWTRTGLWFPALRPELR